MAHEVTSTRRIHIRLTGGIEASEVYSAADNDASPGATELITLAIGANTITKPGGGSTVTGVTIIPPEANTSLITLKGIAADTGIPLHDTDPTSLGLDSTESTFVLDAVAEIVGVRLIWT
jgi:hypothetical protein